MPKLDGTKIGDIVKKTVVPTKVPIPPKVSLPGGQPMNASTGILDDIVLWFRNRIKRMASQEGQGIDAGSLVPSIPKLLNVAGIFARWWIPIVAMAAIVVLLIVLRVV